MGKHVKKNSLGDPGINGRIIIRWILHKKREFGIGRSGFGCGQLADPCEGSNEPSGFHKCKEFFDCLWICCLLKKDSLLLEVK